jgi:hypothetical protein
MNIQIYSGILTGRAIFIVIGRSQLLNFLVPEILGRNQNGKKEIHEILTQKFLIHFLKYAVLSLTV